MKGRQCSCADEEFGQGDGNYKKYSKWRTKKLNYDITDKDFL